jgi:death-on-curing protein
MIEFEYLETEDIVEMIRALSVGPIRDLGLLDSAVNRPRSSAFGEDAYETLDRKAAALLHSMTKNHALVDGNKRLAWLSTTVLCDLNGFASDLTDDYAFQLVWDIASSAEEDITAIADRLHLSPTAV